MHSFIHQRTKSNLASVLNFPVPAYIPLIMIYSALAVSLLLCLSSHADRLENDLNIVLGESFRGEDLGPLVIGGAEVPMYKYPYTSGMRKTADGTSFCGGTLIAPKYIITAAHCVKHIKYVSVGTHFRTGAEDGIQIKAAKVISHPSYNRPRKANDIAIVELEEEVPEAGWVAHLGENEPAAGTVATLHGWGRVSYPGDGSEVLKEVDLPIVSQRECQSKLGGLGGVGVRIHASMICAGGAVDEAACHGDSGGPLVVNKAAEPPVLVGAVSFGKPCGKGRPDAYARISHFKDFIDKHVTGHTWVSI